MIFEPMSVHPAGALGGDFLGLFFARRNHSTQKKALNPGCPSSAQLKEMAIQ